MIGLVGRLELSLLGPTDLLGFLSNYEFVWSLKILFPEVEYVFTFTCSKTDHRHTWP